MNDVTAIVSTKGRYFTTLPNCLVSIATQTYRPKCLIIYDDNDSPPDLRQDPIYQNIFALLQVKGIDWKVNFGKREGQVKNHQQSLQDVQTEWIWRIDDDNYLEADVLEKLIKNITPEVGAVAGLVIDPKMTGPMPSLASNKIQDIYNGLNIQWYRHSGITEVDHLYSSFIFRKEAAKHGYCMSLSPAGHREETIFTYEMKRAGWKLLVDSSAVTWHLRSATGGIRSFSQKEFWAKDEEVFVSKLKEWAVRITPIMPIVLDNGLGDHLIFKKLLPEVRKKSSNIVMAVCYPEVFEDDKDIKLISIADAQMMWNTFDFNVYRFMIDENWKGSVADAYRKLYGI